MIENIFKGFIIGIGKIIPGVSGSMLAISLNVYEKLLYTIANIKKINYGSFKFLFSITLGIIISIIMFSKIIKWSLNTIYVPIMFLFIGLILGGFPDILKEIKGKTNKKINYLLVFTITFIFSYLITQISSINLKSNSNIFTFFILGLIEAFSSIIPGISGTAIYISLGIYNELLTMFSNLLNPNYLNRTFFFTIGVITGTYIIAKLITYLLKNQKKYTFVAIFGFMSSSIIIMLKQTLKSINDTNYPQLIIGIVLLYIGIKITKKINNISIKNT